MKKKISLSDSRNIVLDYLENISDMPEIFDIIDDGIYLYYLYVCDMIVTLKDCIVLEFLNETKLTQFNNEYVESIMKILLNTKNEQLKHDTLKYIRYKITETFKLCHQLELFEAIDNLNKITNNQYETVDITR